MRINILTLFPEMFATPLAISIVGRARQKGLLKTRVVNIRDFAKDRYGTVDSKPYGGGAGMLLRVDVVDQTLESLNNKGKVILLSPKGKQFTQKEAEKLAQQQTISLVCGHYEGFDARIEQFLTDESYKIGNYILSGGELPALTIIDAVARLLPGVIKNKSLKEETFSQGKDYLEYPQYTKPASYKGWEVPAVLRSGNHQEIEKWKKEKAGKITPRH